MPLSYLFTQMPGAELLERGFDTNIPVCTISTFYTVAKMINEDFQITFGVELELVFTFHEDLLRAYLNSIHDNSHIVKDFSEEDRATMAKQLDVGWYDRPRYMGWGLTGQIQHPLVGWNSSRLLRTYGDEPMQIAREVLRKKLYDVGVHFDQAKQKDFSRWHLTYDSSLVGVDKATLQAQLGARIKSAANCKFSPRTPRSNPPN